MEEENFGSCVVDWGATTGKYETTVEQSSNPYFLDATQYYNLVYEMIRFTTELLSISGRKLRGSWGRGAM